MQRRAEHRDQDNGERRGDEIAEAVDLHHEIHGIHADHHEFGVADPGHVDDAEDQIEPEREQRQHAAEQDAVDHGLQQIDVENVQERLHAHHTPRYASLTVSLASISADVPDALIVPASIR